MRLVKRRSSSFKLSPVNFGNSEETAVSELFSTRNEVFKKPLFPLQDIKAVKTKNKKGDVADGKKKAKKEQEEKWKW